MPASTKPIDPDELVRNVIPTRQDIPTRYHPCGRYLMVKKLNEISKVGLIELPDRHRIQLDEGHIVESGPQCVASYGQGDCVFWNMHTDISMEIDGVRFSILHEDQVIMRIPADELRAAAERGELPSDSGILQ
jgi:co-chaperonin GroES (HSP10)